MHTQDRKIGVNIAAIGCDTFTHHHHFQSSTHKTGVTRHDCIIHQMMTHSWWVYIEYLESLGALLEGREGIVHDANVVDLEI